MAATFLTRDLGIVATTAAPPPPLPPIYQFSLAYPLLQSMFSLDILAPLFAKLIETRRLRRQYSMTLNGGVCILNYSGAVLTNFRIVFGLLFFKVGREKAKRAKLSKNSLIL